MSLLAGKRLLITGVLTTESIAYHVARLCLEEGAEIVLTGAGRGLALTRRAARRLGEGIEVLPMDVTSEGEILQCSEWVQKNWGRLDGLLHAIAFAPQSCLGDDVFKAPWQDVALAMHISAFSLKALCAAFRGALKEAGSASVVALDFDAEKAWPSYNWMGVAKAALESLTRYLARDLGPDHIRVNLVAAGPIRTMAAKSIPGFELFEEEFAKRAPLGWNVKDAEPVARACVALFSDYLSKTTGEIVHVDGGFHAVGG